jgi:hypothetical protein
MRECEALASALAIAESDAALHAFAEAARTTRKMYGCSS